MGTQVSKGLGAADRVASQQKVNSGQNTATKQRSAPKEAASRPDQVREDFIKIDETAKEKARAVEVKTLERQDANAAFEANKRTQKESVLEAYGMDSAAGKIQAQMARKNELDGEKAATLERQADFAARRRASELQKSKTAQVTQDAAQARQQTIEDLAQQRVNDMNGSGDVSKIAEILGVSSDADVIMLDLKRDMEETAAFVQTEEEGKARKAAQAVVASERRLKEALSQSNFGRDQDAQIRKDAATASAKRTLQSEQQSVVPESTLSIVPRTNQQAEPKEATQQADRSAEPVSEIIDPREIRLGNEEEKERSMRLVDDALQLTQAIDSSVKELADVAKERAKDVIADVSLKVASPRLRESDEAARVADEAAQLLKDDPVRTLQSQTAMSIDTALRVLR